MQLHHQPLAASTEVGQQEEREPQRTTQRRLQRTSRKRKRQLQRKRRRNTATALQRRDGATQEKETTAITTVKTTKGKGHKGSYYQGGATNPKGKGKGNYNTSQGKGACYKCGRYGHDASECRLAIWQLHEGEPQEDHDHEMEEIYSQDSNLGKTTQLQVIQTTQETVGKNQNGATIQENKIGGTTTTNLVHQATTTQPTTSVESTKGWSSDTTKTRTRPTTTEMRATVRVEAITKTGTAST